MPQRISVSQLKSKLRPAQSRRRQAIAKLNQEIRTYNSKVRAHNSQIRTNINRLRREFRQLERTGGKIQYVTYRLSVETVNRLYERLEQRARAHAYDSRFDRFLDLSRHEAANAVSLINAIHGDEHENGTVIDLRNSQIERPLDTISQDFGVRWREALIAQIPQSAEAVRHFSRSAKEFLAEILNRLANDTEVMSVIPHCDLTQHGKPTHKAKLQYIFQPHGIVNIEVLALVNDHIEDVGQSFRALNDGTHRSSSRLEHSKLVAIRVRLKGLISLLLEVITGQAFAEAQHTAKFATN